jgi:hypothetical protein
MKIFKKVIALQAIHLDPEGARQRSVVGNGRQNTDLIVTT